jgi:hypothetical protein
MKFNATSPTPQVEVHHMKFNTTSLGPSRREEIHDNNFDDTQVQEHNTSDKYLARRAVPGAVRLSVPRAPRVFPRNPPWVPWRRSVRPPSAHRPRVRCRRATRRWIRWRRATRRWIRHHLRAGTSRRRVRTRRLYLHKLKAK